jgi:hypothetical protein
MVASLLVLRKLCSILFLCVLFLTLLAQKILSVITHSREELLDISAPSIYQHYDQEYDFPEVDPLDIGSNPRGRPKTMLSLQERQTEHSLFHGNMVHSRYVVRVGTATGSLHASCRQKQTSLW